MVDWSSSAFVFPGQASQEVGMSKDIVAQHPAAREVFEQADTVLGFALSKLCFDGPEDVLNDTINTQPALFTSGIAILSAIQAEYPQVKPAMMAGHSLGELTALVAADSLSFADGLRLVRERGRLMKEAGEHNPGVMAAILGLSTEDLDQICRDASNKTGCIVIVANDNCPGQLVISGDHESVDAAMALAKTAGAKKTVKLAVSIAAHSPLMEPASNDFRDFLSTIEFRTPSTVVYGNVDAKPLTTVPAIRLELEQQLTHSVRWTELVQAMIRDGAEIFIELGPKDILSGLIKRINRDTKRFTLNNLLALNEFMATSS